MSQSGTYYNPFGSSEKRTAVEYPVPFRNPLRSGAMIILFVILIILLIWTYTLGVPTAFKNANALGLVILFIIFGLIVYLFWNSGHTAWSWTVAIIFLLLLFLGYFTVGSAVANTKSSISDRLSNIGQSFTGQA